MSVQELTDWQKEFLESLRKENWTIEEPPIDAEPEESEENKLRNEIESSPDYERLIVRPSEECNLFNNISAEILRSKKLNKQITFLYKYKNLIRNGKLVGREGGVNDFIIENYSSKNIDELKAKYSIIKVM